MTHRQKSVLPSATPGEMAFQMLCCCIWHRGKDCLNARAAQEPVPVQEVRLVKAAFLAARQK